MPKRKADAEPGIPEETKPAEVKERKTPDVEADFTALIVDYGVQEKLAVITKYIAEIIPSIAGASLTCSW